MSQGTRLRRGLYSACWVFGLALAAFAADAGAQNVYVTNWSSNDVTTINDRTKQPIGPAIRVGSAPEAIAITPDGRTAYVANEGTDNVSVIDLQTRQVVGLPIPVGNGPLKIAITPDGTTALVVNNFSDSVTVIDLRTNQALGSPIGVGRRPEGLAIAHDGKTAYVPNYEDDNVSVIDIPTRTVTSTIPVGNGPEPIAISPDGKTAYVGDLESSLTVIDLQTNLPVPPEITVDSSNPVAIVFTPDGKTAYVPHLESGTISVVDTQQRKLVSVVERNVHAFTVGMALTPDGRTAYVSNFDTDNVSTIDTQANRVVGSPIPVGDGAGGIAIAPLDLPPVALISLRPVVRLGAPVGLDGSTSYDADGSVGKFLWSFGDRSKAPGGTDPKLHHTFLHTGKYNVTLTVTDDQGCSTAPLRSGPSLSCNGSSLAKKTSQLKVVYPRVQVKCPVSAGPKGCKFTLQGVATKRKPVAETGITKVKVKAGKSALAPLKPKRRFVKKLGTAHVILVRDSEVIRGSSRTTLRRLILR